MSVETPQTHVETRIGFAERWLHRARAQYAGGDATAGLRMLALADAEVRVALEAEGWAARRAAATHAGRWTPWLLLAAAAAAAVWTFRPAAVPVDAGVVDGPPIVRLSPTVGTLLSVMAVSPAEAYVAGPAVGRRQPTGRQGARRSVTTAPSSSAPAVVVSPAPAIAHPISGPAPARPAAPAAAVPPSSSMGSSFVLSEVDLIDMVLAATQALRGTGP